MGGGWGRDERVDDIYFEDLTSSGNPTTEGVVRYVDNDIVAFVDGQVKSLTSGTGLNPATHQALDQLVHMITEDSFEEVVRDSKGRVTDHIIWTDVTKTTKIRESSYTRAGCSRISQVVTKQYDGTGTLAITMTETLTRTASGQVASITRTRT